MADPRIENVLKIYGGIEDQTDRDGVKDWLADYLLAHDGPQAAHALLREADTISGEDWSSRLFKTPVIPPLTSAESASKFEEMKGQAPWYKRWGANILTAVEKYQKNVGDPLIGSIFAGAFKLAPGEQDFERRMKEAQASLREKYGEEKQRGILNWMEAAKEAYYKQDTPWGVKGFMELVVDPLNLVGLGVPGKLMSKAPKALKPILLPLHILDRTPDKAVEMALKGTGKAFTATPGVKRLTGLLAEPHHTAKVKDTWRRIYATTNDFFGEKIVGGTPADTVEALSNRTNWPDDTGSFSFRSIWNKLDEFYGKRFETIEKNVMGMTPEEASAYLAGLAADIDRQAILKGGTRISGEVVEKGVKAQRREKIQGFFEGLRLDQDRAQWIANGVDEFVTKAWDNVYLRKIEPQLVRPWALAHLAFTGFAPMNIIEDVGFGVLGMGGLKRGRGVADDMWRLAVGDLPETPQHLHHLEDQVNNMLDVMTGVYKANRSTPLQKIVDALGGQFVRASSRVGKGVRRQAYLRRFQKEFAKQLDQLGVKQSDLKGLKQFIETEFPEEAGAIFEDLSEKIWMVASRGDADAIRGIKGMVSSKRYIQRAQVDVLEQFPEMPTDVRRTFLKRIWREGGITRENMEATANELREHMLDWHKFTTVGIKARLGDFVDALGKRSPRTPSEAAGVLRMLQAANDTLADVPRELNAHARQLAKNKSPLEKERIWTDAMKTIDEDLGAVRKMYQDALTRTKPDLERLLAQQLPPAQQSAMKQSIDQIFDNYDALSKNLQDTWQQHRAQRRALFSSTPPEERTSSFWLEVESLGEELWESEMELRSMYANRAREGWVQIFDALPRELGPKDRQFMKAGLESALGDASQKQDKLLAMRDQLQNRLVIASDASVERIQSRLNFIDNELVISKKHIDEIEERLANYSFAREPLRPKALRDADRSIRQIKADIADAEQRELHPMVLSQLIDELDNFTNQRAQAFEDLIPQYAKGKWDELNVAVSDAEARLANAIGPNEQRAIRAELRKATAERNKFSRGIEKGEALSEFEKITGVTRRHIAGAADEVLTFNSGNLPRTVDEMVSQLETMDSPKVQEFLAALPEDDAAQVEAFEHLYSQVAQRSNIDQLSPRHLQTLRDAQVGDVMPTGALVELVEGGHLKFVKQLRNGRWRTEITEQGEELLERTSTVQLTDQDILATMPEPLKQYNSIIDEQMEGVNQAITGMIDVVDNPPIGEDAIGTMNGYIDRVANQLDGMTDFKSKAREARLNASKITADEYNKMFVDYDNRTVGDFIMQRFMPFWMYESRRWPRIARIAAKRPILAKYGVQLSLDWDYGYNPTWAGFEFNPAKGTAMGSLRRIGVRDFPELHEGYRGGWEQFTDWLGRGGFYFSPLISGVQSAAMGEPASMIPPPISLALHGITAATGSIPEPLHSLAFDSRFTNMYTDLVIADKYGKSAATVRGLAERGDEGAQTILRNAEREAAWRLIVNNQASTVRYRPTEKEEFKQASSEVIEEVLGIDQKMQEELRKLGMSPYEMIATSGPQRAAIRDRLQNYDHWYNSTISLKPIEEQKALKAQDSFWNAMETERDRYKAEVSKLSDWWERGIISGSMAIDELSTLRRQRATLFDRIHSLPEYKDVPITYEDRVKYAERYGKPSPMLSPVDEALEMYYAIKVEDYENPDTGDTDWNAFYDTRNQILENYPEPIRSIVESELRKTETPLERALTLAEPYRRMYYGIRDQVHEQMSALDPMLGDAYKMYRRIKNQAQKEVDPNQKAYLEQQARQILSMHSQLSVAEAVVRNTRLRMRHSDPEMERVYQLFIASPGSIPTRQAGIMKLR